MLYVITGIRGSGKTTLIDNLSRENIVAVLQPSTTRRPRFEGEMEYDFVGSWEADRYAWSIRYGSDFYGMRRSEVLRTLHVDAVTVFEPTSIGVFYEFRRTEGIPATTIGLDTVHDEREQHIRVAGSQIRLMSPEEFGLARKMVRGCDAVLSGDAEAILLKVSEIIRSNAAH